MTETSETTIDDLSPSAKLVYTVLDHSGPTTQKELIQASRLSARTVRYALGDLQDADIVTERVYLPDARQSLYELSSASDGHATADRTAGRATTSDD
jgi:DNA-binding MarR family transcriptional regulator